MYKKYVWTLSHDQMAQIPIKSELFFFNILRIVLFDFQSPLSIPSGTCWRKKLTQNYGFWNSVSDWQKTPLRVLIFICKLSEPRIRLRPIIFQNVIVTLRSFIRKFVLEFVEYIFKLRRHDIPPFPLYLWFLSRILAQPKLSTIERTQIMRSYVLNRYKMVNV